MTVATMSAWLLRIFVAVAPLGRETPPDAAETAEEARERYEILADAIAETATNEPPLFTGERGRARTALVLAAVGYMESGLRKDVTEGLRLSKTGDCGTYQIHVGLHLGDVRTCAELVSDHRREARIALDLMRRSFRVCGRYGAERQLAIYTSGSCFRGVEESRVRLKLAARWEQRFPLLELQP